MRLIPCNFPMLFHKSLAGVLELTFLRLAFFQFHFCTVLQFACKGTAFCACTQYAIAETLTFDLLAGIWQTLSKNYIKNRRNLLCYSGLGGMWGSTPRLQLPNFDRCNSLIFSMLINQFTIIFALFGTLVVQLSEQIAQENTKLFVSISICYRESEKHFAPKAVFNMSDFL